MNKKISMIGAGSWGTALSILLAKSGCNVSMWSCFKEEVEMVNNKREHLLKLPGVLIPEGVSCTDNIEDSINGAEAVILVVPSQTIRKSAALISRYIKDHMVVVSCSKGLEEETGLRLSEVIKQEIPQCREVVLSGPSHAEEVARDIPTTVVSASTDIEAAEYIQSLFMSPKFRVYTNSDIIGVELGAALKNVIALCAGISDGLGFGDNTKAALMTRGMAEISRLGISMGSSPQTFAGLAGIGDLIVTCTSMHSRNRRAGILIGQGKSPDEAMKEVNMVVEGVTTTRAAYKLAKKEGVSMPITSEAFEVLFNGKDAKLAVVDLMTRNKRSEVEELEGSSWI